MTTAIKRRRGTTTQHSSFTGLEGELTVDTTKDTVVVHDGSTAGGFALLREDLSNNTNVVTLAGTQTLSNKTFSDNPVLSSGTANGVAYLNGSKVLTTGSALTFDGTNLSMVGTGNRALSITTNTSGNPSISLVAGGVSAGLIQYNRSNIALELSADGSTPFYSIDYTGIHKWFGPSNAEQMRLTSTGLGIGTSSPAVKLQVVGTAAFGDGTNGQLRLTSNASINYIDSLNNAASAWQRMDSRAIQFNWFTAASGAPATGMTLDSSGNLGLGVTPSAWGGGMKALQINKTSLAGLGNSGYLMNNAYFDGSSFKYIASDYANLYTQNNTLGQHAWYTAPSGTAGNAISFTQAMDLSNSGNYTTLNLGAAFGTDINFKVGSTTIAAIAGDSTAGSNGFLLFRTNGSERMRIDSSGNVGIGTSSPSSYGKLAIAGNATVISGAGFYLQNTDNSAFAHIKNGGGTSVGQMEFYTANVERMRIDSSGNLLVGTTSGSSKVTINTSGAAALSASGSTSADQAGIVYFINTSLSSGTGTRVLTIGQDYSGNAVVFDYQGAAKGTIVNNGSTVAYNTSSDYRLKENIQPMQNALGVVAQLNPVTYTWKADGSDGQGFIAHELQAVVPDCVTGEKDAVDAEGKPVYQGIDTSFLVATLTKAIQEQQEQINQLKAEVAALKGV